MAQCFVFKHPGPYKKALRWFAKGRSATIFSHRNFSKNHTTNVHMAPSRRFPINSTFSSTTAMFPASRLSSSAYSVKKSTKLSPPFRRFSVCCPKYFTPPLMCQHKYEPQDLARTELLNGIRVVGSRLTGYHLAACTILFAAGSRYERTYESGCTHFIRVCSDSHGKGYSSLAKSRVLQQFGAYLSCTTDRQNIMFTLQCAPPDFPALKHLLLDAAVRNNYADFDIDERRRLVSEDLVRITPQQRVMDLIQRACWTGPLHNSPFCPPECIQSMCSNYLKCFVYHNFLSTGCTVASIGVPYEETMKMAEEIQHGSERPPPRKEQQPLPKAGFEMYDLGRGHDTWIAAAVPGIGTLDRNRNINNLLKYAVLAESLGSSAMALGHQSDQAMQLPLGQLAGGDDANTSFRAFSLSYWDVGVFGILAQTRASSAQAVARAAQVFLGNVHCIEPADIVIGKQRLKLQLARQEEHATRSSESLALMAANNITLDHVSTLFGLVDCLPIEEIMAVAVELTQRRNQMSVAVVGDVGMVSVEKPYC